MGTSNNISRLMFPVRERKNTTDTPHRVAVGYGEYPFQG